MSPARRPAGELSPGISRPAVSAGQQIGPHAGEVRQRLRGGGDVVDHEFGVELDVIHLDAERCVFFVGDVSGRGLGAATIRL